ncbi:MAG: hypothetical protein ACI8W3_000246 [Myxococcota bacterium]|jgi:hypothetical protein
MSDVQCNQCNDVFDGKALPACPACLAAAWLATENFVRPKHDPRLLPLAWEGYRSVLNPALVNTPREHLAYAAQHGTWFRDTYYDMFVHMTFEPLGRAPGSGIPEGKVSPEHSLDALLIVEANSAVEAHGFAVARTQFDAQIKAGEFEPLTPCRQPACDNIASPGHPTCGTHLAGKSEANPEIDHS